MLLSSFPSYSAISFSAKFNKLCGIPFFFQALFFEEFPFFHSFSVVFIVFLCFTMVKLFTDSVLELTAPSKLVLRPLMNWYVRDLQRFFVNANWLKHTERTFGGRVFFCLGEVQRERNR